MLFIAGHGFLEEDVCGRGWLQVSLALCMMVMLLLVLVGYVTGECSILLVSTLSLGPSDIMGVCTLRICMIVTGVCTQDLSFLLTGGMYPSYLLHVSQYIKTMSLSCFKHSSYQFHLIKLLPISIFFLLPLESYQDHHTSQESPRDSPQQSPITTPITTRISTTITNHHENHHNDQHSWLIDLTRITTLDSFILPSSSTLGSIHLNLYFSSTIEVSNKQNYMFNNR